MTGEQKPGGLSTPTDLAGLCERLRADADSFADQVLGIDSDGPTAALEREAAAAIESLVELTRKNLATMEWTVRRLSEAGRSHHELDDAIAQTRTALEGASDDR